MRRAVKKKVFFFAIEYQKGILFLLYRMISNQQFWQIGRDKQKRISLTQENIQASIL